MSFVHIKRIQRPDPLTGLKKDMFAVSAMSIVTPQGKKLIPNPSGKEAAVFESLEEAEAAIRQAGFDYEFEGKKTYTLGKGEPTGTTRSQPVLSVDPLRDAVPVLIERLRDREPAVVANAAFALGALQAREAARPLGDMLGHEDASVRKNAAEALARLGADALPVLKESYQSARMNTDRNAAYIRLTVMQAYQDIAQTQRGLTHQFLGQALEALQDENWLVRAQAALVIGHAAPHLSESE